jgi:hypothetical protein
VQESPRKIKRRAPWCDHGQTLEGLARGAGGTGTPSSGTTALPMRVGHQQATLFDRLQWLRLSVAPPATRLIRGGAIGR